MGEANGPAAGAGIEIPAPDGYFQQIAPPGEQQRFEGVAFSPSGDVLGVATSDTNTVFLFRKKTCGCFEREPFWTLTGRGAGLDYPHDVSFSRAGDREHFAVAQRTGAVSVYQRSGPGEGYGREPAFRIRGPRSKLRFSDAVAFVPPDHRYMAVANLESNLVSFFRRKRGAAPRFRSRPSFGLQGGAIFQPDGLAFSADGAWLAVANHGNHTVSLFRRRRGRLLASRWRYGPEPAAVLRDPTLRHPHSVAFTESGRHLVVTNAGANYFNVYALLPAGAGEVLTGAPVLRKTVGDSETFAHVNARNKKEGGPKGVAIHGDRLALCSPELGLLIYSFRETEGERRVC